MSSVRKKIFDDILGFDPKPQPKPKGSVKGLLDTVKRDRNPDGSPGLTGGYTPMPPRNRPHPDEISNPNDPNRGIPLRPKTPFKPLPTEGRINPAFPPPRKIRHSLAGSITNVKPRLPLAEPKNPLKKKNRPGMAMRGGALSTFNNNNNTLGA